MVNIKLDEKKFLANVNTLSTLINDTLFDATATHPYLAVEIYVALRQLLVAYSTVLGPAAVKKIESSIMFVSKDDYKDC